MNLPGKSLDSRPTPDWFSDGKFGIFITLGRVFGALLRPDRGCQRLCPLRRMVWMRLSNPDMEGHAPFKAFHDRVYGPSFRVPGFPPMFKAELFDPDRWADLFRRSGAKYVVLTSKHHEGFCLWPSGPELELETRWISARTGTLRRPDCCGAESGPEKWDSTIPSMNGSILFTIRMWTIHCRAYVSTDERPGVPLPAGDPVDGREWDHPSAKWRSGEFLAWLFNDSPVGKTVAVNDRWGKETRGVHGGYYTTEYGLVHDKAESGTTLLHPWEECRGIGNSFGYNRAENTFGLFHASKAHPSFGRHRVAGAETFYLT